MEEKIKELTNKLEDASFAEKLFKSETPEEAQALLKEQGLEFSIEEVVEINQALAQLTTQSDGELSDDDLEDVAGGVARRPGGPYRPLPYPPRTGDMSREEILKLIGRKSRPTI